MKVVEKFFVIGELPSWYTSNGESFSIVYIHYCDDEKPCLNLQSLEELISNVERDMEITDLSEKITFINYNNPFQLIICYDDVISRILQEMEYLLINQIYEFYSYSENLNYLLELVDMVETYEEELNSTESIISLINNLSEGNFRKSFVHLITKYLIYSQNEIKILYRIDISKIILMSNIHEEFEKLVYDTISISEVIAAKCLGNLEGKKSRDIPNFIDNTDFLVSYISEKKNTALDRYNVLSSLIYRETLPVTRLIELVDSNLYDLKTNIRNEIEDKKLIIFLLEQTINRSVQDFVNGLELFQSKLELNNENIADIVLQSGKTTDLIEYLERKNNNQFQLLVESLEKAMEPLSESEEDQSRIDGL